MKKLFTLSLIILACAATFAQTIPNASFEDWSDATTPVGWNSKFSTSFPIEYSGISATVVIDYNAATRYADAHQGTYSAQLRTQTANLQIMGMTVYSINLPAIMQLGQFNFNGISDLDFENIDVNALDLTQYLNGGIACNQIPQKMTAWIAYAPYDGDTMHAAVVLTRWNNGQREIVAQGNFASGDNDTDFRQIEVPIAVVSGMEGVTPDTLNIIFTTSMSMTNENTALVVDDVELAMANGIVEVTTLPLFSIYPNPATDHIVLSPLAAGEYSAQLFDANGRLAYSASALNGETSINTTSFAKGVYMLKVKQGENVKSEKVIVR